MGHNYVKGLESSDNTNTGLSTKEWFKEYAEEWEEIEPPEKNKRLYIQVINNFKENKRVAFGGYIEMTRVNNAVAIDICISLLIYDVWIDISLGG